MKIIYQLLKQAGLKNKALQEEYLDHYTTQFEQLVISGKTESEAFSQVKKSIDQLDINYINSEFFNLNYKNNIIMITTIFIALFGSFLLISNQNEPPHISPIALEKLDITSQFGYRIHPLDKKKKMHKGIDIKAELGTPVIAPSSGRIIEVGQNQSLGKYIVIQHDEIYATRYHHLNEICVKKNQKVKKGEPIGKVGSSGLSLAPHLHYEVLENGKHVNPRDFIKA